MTPAARGPDFGVAIFCVRHSPDPANMGERRDKQCTSTNICPLGSNVRGNGKGPRCTLDGLDFVGKGKVGATPAIAAWCLRIDVGSRTLSSRTTIGDIAITRMFLSPVYTLMQVAPARRHYFHRVSSQDARVLRTSHHQIMDTIRWEYEIAWHRLGIYKKNVLTPHTTTTNNFSFPTGDGRQPRYGTWNERRKSTIDQESRGLGCFHQRLVHNLDCQVSLRYRVP